MESIALGATTCHARNSTPACTISNRRALAKSYRDHSAVLNMRSSVTPASVNPEGVCRARHLRAGLSFQVPSSNRIRRPVKHSRREVVTFCVSEESHGREEQEQKTAVRPEREQKSERVSGKLTEPTLPDWLLPLTGAPVAAGLLGANLGLDVSGPASVASAIACLAAIVAVHEAGHFTAARVQNIIVSKFSIGFGPTVWRYEGEVVEYSLRAFPLGGYVAFPDDDPDSDIDPDDPDLLRNRPIKDRALVISAGVIANIIFAYSILFVQMGTYGEAVNTYLPGAQVPELLQVSAARRAGIQVGDVILSVDGAPVAASQAAVTETVKLIREHPEEELIFHVKRGGQELDIPVTPIKGSKNQGLIGCQLSANVETRYERARDPIQAAKAASRSFNRLAGIVLDGLNQIVFNFSQVSSQVAGPVAIVAVGAEAAKNDASGIFQFAAIVNINLALFNALPIPALDGGYMALLALEAVRRKKLPVGVEQGIMGSGFLLMLGLGIVLIVKDTINLVQ